MKRTPEQRTELFNSIGRVENLVNKVGRLIENLSTTYDDELELELELVAKYLDMSARLVRELVKPGNRPPPSDSGSGGPCHR